MADPTSLTFHPFPRLPLELRQQIWALSMEPREVVIGAKGYLGPGLHGTPPPPLLLACAESRSYIQQFYTKSFLRDRRKPSEGPKKLWINLDLDDLKMMEYDFPKFSAIPLIQRLTVVTDDTEWFERKYLVPNIWKATALKRLTVVDEEGEREFGWVIGWSGFLQNLYHKCDPASSYTTIICDNLILTRYNWLKRLRQLRRENWGPDMVETPQDYTSDDAISEDDVDPRDSRFMRWKHTKDCVACRKTLGDHGRIGVGHWSWHRSCSTTKAIWILCPRSSRRRMFLTTIELFGHVLG